MGRPQEVDVRHLLTSAVSLAAAQRRLEAAQSSRRAAEQRLEEVWHPTFHIFYLQHTRDLSSVLYNPMGVLAEGFAHREESLIPRTHELFVNDCRHEWRPSYSVQGSQTYTDGGCVGSVSYAHPKSHLNGFFHRVKVEIVDTFIHPSFRMKSQP